MKIICNKKNREISQKTGKIIKAIGEDRKLSFTILSLLTVVLFSLNMYVLHSTLIGILSFVIYLAVNSVFFGNFLARIVTPESWLTPLFGSLLLVLLIGFSGAVFVLFIGLSRMFIVFILLLLAIVASLLLHNRKNQVEPKNDLREAQEVLKAECKKTNKFLGIGLFLLILFGFIMLFFARSYNRSTVWGAIPIEYIGIYILATFMVTLLIFSKYGSKTVLFFIVLHSILLYSYITMVCGTLYGSDPWSALGAEKALLAERVPRNLTPTILDVLSNKGGFNWRNIGGLPVPEAFISRFSRLGYNAITVIFSSMLQVDVLWINILLVPVIWIFSSALIWFQIGKYLSTGRIYALLLSFTPALFCSIIGRGAIGVPAGIGAIFLLLSLLLWVNFLIKRNRSSFLLALFVTSTSLFFHTAYFVVSIEIAVVSILISVFLTDKRRGLTRLLTTFCLIVILLIMVIPCLDMIDNTYFKPEFLHNPLSVFSSFINWVADFSGLTGTSLSPNTLHILTGNSFLAGQFCVASTRLLWLLVIVGLFNYKKVNKRVMVLFVALLTITHLDNFIVWYLMDGLHPVGRYIDTSMEFFKVPLVALGILSVIDLTHSYGKAKGFVLSASQHLKFNKKVRINAIILLTCVFLTIVSTSSYTNDPGAIWASRDEVNALTYINNISQQQNYCVISEPFSLSVLEGISAANMTDGNLRFTAGTLNDFFGGVSYLNEMLQRPSAGVMEKAMEMSNSTVSCFVITPASSGLINAVQQALGQYKQFGSVYVFRWLKNQESTNVQVIADHQQASFWTPLAWGSGSIGVPLINDADGGARNDSSGNQLQIDVENGTYAYWQIRHEYTSSQDWSSKDFLSFYMNDINRSATFTVRIWSGSGNFYDYEFIDNWVGWKRLVLPFDKFVVVGSPSWSNVNMIQIIMQHKPDISGTWAIDRVTVDSYLPVSW